MDKMLKVLIGLASVAVIAAVVYYFAGEWRDSQQKAAAQQEREWRADMAKCDDIRRSIDTWVGAGKTSAFDLEGHQAKFGACLEEFKGKLFEALYADRMAVTR